MLMVEDFETSLLPVLLWKRTMTAAKQLWLLLSLNLNFGRYQNLIVGSKPS